MKNILFMLFVCVLFACNNEATDTTTKDSTVIQQDNTINKDTGMNYTDTANKRDSVR